MYTICICAQKGGVAKTTTAQTIGAGLTARGKRVLLVDLDGQCSLTAALTGKEAGRGVMDVITGKAKAVNMIYRTTAGDLIPATGACWLAEAETVLQRTGKETRLKTALEAVKGQYDYCIIDCPPSLGILTINALSASDGVIIPAAADYLSIKAVQQISQTITAVKNRINPALNVYGILITRYNGRSILSRDSVTVLEAEAAKMGTRVFNTKIRECTALKESQAVHENIYTYAPRSNGVKDYDTLITELEDIM